MKIFKPFFIFVVLFAAGLSIYFLFFSKSYQLSMGAKVEYLLGNYEKAYNMAKDSYALDQYNRMAFTVLTQSKIAFKFLKYIEDSKNYLQTIDQLSSKQNFSKSDKIKIKMICEVMIERYKRLNPTILTSKELYKQVSQEYQKFQQIYEKLF